MSTNVFTTQIGNKKISRVRLMTVIAMFAAISTILMYFEVPLPFLPPFLKVDLSGVPILIMGYMFGPMPAVYVTLIKDAIHVLSSNSGGVGQLADFICLSSFVFVASIIYNHRKTKRNVLLSAIMGTITMSVMAIIANKFLLIPFYSKLMPIEQIFGACKAINPMITGMNTYLIYGVIPFSIIKGIILYFFTFILYKKLSGFIKSRMYMC